MDLELERNSFMINLFMKLYQQIPGKTHQGHTHAGLLPSNAMTSRGVRLHQVKIYLVQHSSSSRSRVDAYESLPAKLSCYVPQ